ncbi:hypothetical protein PBT90_12235 [Algoriphagus halophytocola]|uniref:DUF3592 domain-containing protein n=1 Tax=Algoriphagus halophytocola TaxID=2991499 RepID=A0ABY6MK42_9BACT|nr:MULTISPECIES: hypothetical protein [unclassified Algoriphagus]UZD24152.1 hypothetical protein OM944_06545 [Algoriphagus sp. TR-M5]WBL41523.1 hypothetical protein PBT90_12235 [Algoriphagus sp. TR-M9]
MKFTTIYQGENKIEIFNSWLGKEVIKVNDEIVSSKYSVFGTDHTFSMMDNGIESHCKINIGYGINGIVFDFYKNERPIIESPRAGCGFIFWLILLVGFIVGVAVNLLTRG